MPYGPAGFSQMMRRSSSALPLSLADRPNRLFVLLAASALFVACGTGDDDDTTADRDGGTSRDAGPPRDAGFRDAGFRDAGPRRDAGHYCRGANGVDVDGTSVPVDDVTDEPRTEFGAGVTSCIDDPISPQAMSFEYCLFECVDFMGAQPTADDIAALEIAVFPFVDDQLDPVDPSYDWITGQDRQPSERLPVGYNFRTVQGAICDSGWAMELGFSDLGATTLFGERLYNLRVRSSTASSPFIDTYYPGFIRRNASPEVAGANCQLSSVERTTPDATFEFVIGSRDLLSAAATGAGVPVPGSDDLDDGLGNGYALIEARDCSSSDGRSITNASGGFSPLPLGDYYPDDDYDLARRERYTAQRGRYLATGFAGVTATSSLAVDVTYAVGVSTDGTCTEEFGGGIVPIHSDSLTVIRTNHEDVIHGF